MYISLKLNSLKLSIADFLGGRGDQEEGKNPNVCGNRLRSWKLVI